MTPTTNNNLERAQVAEIALVEYIRRKYERDPCQGDETDDSCLVCAWPYCTLSPGHTRPSTEANP